MGRAKIRLGMVRLQLLQCFLFCSVQSKRQEQGFLVLSVRGNKVCQVYLSLQGKRGGSSARDIQTVILLQICIFISRYSKDQCNHFLFSAKNIYSHFFFFSSFSFLNGSWFSMKEGVNLDYIYFYLQSPHRESSAGRKPWENSVGVKTSTMCFRQRNSLQMLLPLTPLTLSTSCLQTPSPSTDWVWGSYFQDFTLSNECQEPVGPGCFSWSKMPWALQCLKSPALSHP